MKLQMKSEMSLAQEIGNKHISVIKRQFIRLISIGFLVGMFNQLSGINGNIIQMLIF